MTSPSEPHTMDMLASQAIRPCLMRTRISEPLDPPSLPPLPTTAPVEEGSTCCCCSSDRRST